MLDLAILSNIAEIVSTVTVVGGSVFALIQLRQYRISRRNTSTTELMRSFYDPELARAQDSWAEWFQWLAERLAEKGDDRKSSAYVRGADWRPRS